MVGWRLANHAAKLALLSGPAVQAGVASGSECQPEGSHGRDRPPNRRLLITGCNVGIRTMLPEETSRTAATRTAYTATAMRLFSQAEKALGLTEFANAVHVPQIVEWFLSADHRWAPNTIRLYRAALREVLELLCRKMAYNGHVLAALDRLNTTRGPASSAKADHGTSAKKKKSLSIAEAEAIDAALTASKHPYADLARGYLRHGIELGLRPCEWADARMDGSCLVVINAKATNGRANGMSRSLDLGPVAPGYADEVAHFLGMIDEAVAAEPWAQIHRKVRYVLAAASKKASVNVPSLRKSVFSPYTARHVATARAKRTMDRASVAALLGHATDRTASVHYSRPRSARQWHPIAVAVDPAEVATVKATFRAMDEPPPLQDCRRHPTSGRSPQ